MRMTIFIYNIFKEYQIEFIDKIIKKNKKIPTYCLEIKDEKHNFLQNGFLMGNSKGLEFENVILMDYLLKNDKDLRLTYVGVTRAMKKLFLCIKN